MPLICPDIIVINVKSNIYGVVNKGAALVSLSM